MAENKVSPVAEVAKKHRISPSDEVVLTTEVRVHIRPVGANLIDEVMQCIKDPPVPKIYDEDRQREIENPHDPKYIKDLEEAERRRNIAALDALIMFGVELIDPIPDIKIWLPKLRLMEKHKILDLSEYNLDDPDEQEFLYKRYFAVGTDDITLITGGNTVNPEEVAKQEATFQGDA